MVKPLCFQLVHSEISADTTEGNYIPRTLIKSWSILTTQWNGFCCFCWCEIGQFSEVKQKEKMPGVLGKIKSHIEVGELTEQRACTISTNAIR